ncbi:hypothetical protein [Nonlabens ulvanivorans]|uniref:DNA primase n=1 Tax=Nonlabens ulvanivorans TaxID=906888 RepID=A0A084K028_NONUL|nr:hypothetical protein [Nonlabens ulvanivorans]KEZ94562.1 hypothetical protein IL45_00365 [Nonlabens ulvanivorans]PRX12472.1 hypothetical protein LY02_02537 [Nonlabens ulvanivorans]
MKNVIVDYKKLTPDVLSLLVERYPDGYGDDDIISFKNHKNELIEAVEVKTEDTKYLVKISKRLSMQMEAFDEDDYDEKEMNDPDALPDMDLEQPKDEESDESKED